MTDARDEFNESTMAWEGCPSHGENITSPSPARAWGLGDGGGPIQPGTLHAHVYFSPAKLKAILAAISEREQDPVKLVAWKLSG